MERLRQDTSLMFCAMHNTARVFRNAIAEEVVTTENHLGGVLADRDPHATISSRPVLRAL